MNFIKIFTTTLLSLFFITYTNGQNIIDISIESGMTFGSYRVNEFLFLNSNKYDPSNGYNISGVLGIALSQNYSSFTLLSFEQSNLSMRDNSITYTENSQFISTDFYSSISQNSIHLTSGINRRLFATKRLESTFGLGLGYGYTTFKTVYNMIAIYSSLTNYLFTDEQSINELNNINRHELSALIRLKFGLTLFKENQLYIIFQARDGITNLNTQSDDFPRHRSTYFINFGYLVPLKMNH